MTEIKDFEKGLKQILKYKWRIQSSKPSGCICVAYIDARKVMDLLDHVVGPENWQDEYVAIGGQVFCNLGINYGKGFVYKSDSGSESNVEKEKGLASDCFKRASVKHGVGRFLYEIKPVWLPTWQTVDYKGNKVFKPMHDIKKGICPPNLLVKSKDGKHSLLINEYKINEYILQVLKK